ncbi:hypothetical protein SCANM63S_07322 [Streptomyces canarius]
MGPGVPYARGEVATRTGRALVGDGACSTPGGEITAAKYRAAVDPRLVVAVWRRTSYAAGC